MQSKTESVSKQKASYQNLGFGVLALDMRHTTTPLFLREYISHYTNKNFQVVLTGDQTFCDYKEVP